jgi:hypothetical protein
MTPAATAAAASTVIQAMLAYSSQNPRRVSLARSAGARSPGSTMIHLLADPTAWPAGRCGTTATSAAKENLLAGESVF